MMSSSSSTHRRSRSDASNSRSTSSYGEIIERTALSAISAQIEEEESEPRPPTSPTTDAFDPIRDQVAHTIVLRAVRNAERIDDTNVGVVMTLPHPSGEHLLKAIASRLKRVMLPKQESYLFLLALPLPLPPRGLSPVLICSSSPDLAERAGLLVKSKFLARVERDELRHGRWGALIRDLCAGASVYDEAAFWDAVRKAARRPIDPLIPPPGSRSIAQILAHARARLQRITPRQAYDELLDTSVPWPVVLVDIRPEAQRRSCGAIEGALVVERNVLEWRFDPRCAYRLPIADRYDLRVIVFCQEGYTSSLAAVALHDLGMLNATDVIGGYAAWKEAGLPDEVEVSSSTAPPTDGRVSVPVQRE